MCVSYIYMILFGLYRPPEEGNV